MNMPAPDNFTYNKTIPTEYVIITSLYNTTNSKMFENGEQKSMTGSSPGTNPLSGLTVGSRYATDGTGIRAMTGNIAEMIFINGIIGDIDYGMFHLYLGRKQNRLLGI